MVRARPPPSLDKVRRVGFRDDAADQLCAGTLGRNGRKRKVCNQCVSGSEWSSWMIGWRLSHRPRTCAAFHLRTFDRRKFSNQSKVSQKSTFSQWIVSRLEGYYAWNFAYPFIRFSILTSKHSCKIAWMKEINLRDSFLGANNCTIYWIEEVDLYQVEMAGVKDRFSPIESK